MTIDYNKSPHKSDKKYISNNIENKYMYTIMALFRIMRTINRSYYRHNHGGKEIYICIGNKCAVHENIGLRRFYHMHFAMECRKKLCGIHIPIVFNGNPQRLFVIEN